MSESAMRFSLAASMIGFLIVAPIASAQVSPPYSNPGDIRVDDPKGSVILLSDADRNVPAPVGKAHLRYFQGWTLANPSVRYPSDPGTFTPGPTIRAKVGSKVSILFMNTINDKNFSYSFVTENGEANPQYGCDQSSNPAVYPAKDVFPNCFHGSSTANLHFHGTHTNPDGLGDNVLVQVMPDSTTPQTEWIEDFNQVIDKPAIPAKWADMPADYQTKQEKLVKAKGNDLWASDKQQIDLGQWPQYIAGGYVNTFPLPEYTTPTGKYKAGQAPGTMWYHTHKHGSTALHSLHGLAGAFIIEGAYDQFFQTFYKEWNLANSEKVMVFQMINPDLNLLRGGVNFGSLGPGLLLLNGLSNPTITMRPGEVQLWRIVNATPGSVFKGQANLAGPGVLFPDLFCVGSPAPACQTEGFQVVQTAKDGVQFSPTNFKNQPFLTGQIPNQNGAPNGLILAGGNRADFLVKAPSKATCAPVQFTTNGANAFLVNVAGEPVNMNLPSEADWPQMPEYLADLPPPTDYPHQVTFGWDAEPGRPQVGGGRLRSNVGTNLPPRYTIDNRQFEQFGPLVSQCMPLDSLQEWVLVNETTVTHPFHIHINPFQITKIEAPSPSPTDPNAFTYSTYAPTDNFVWNDVVGIPAGVVLANGQFAPGKVTIRHRFVDFTGTYVLHCHILAHEDRGMMQLVRVVPPNRYPTDCQQAIPRHH